KAGGFGEAPSEECKPVRLKQSPPLGWMMSEATRKVVVKQANDALALACVEACTDWAMGKEGAVCKAPIRPRPIEVIRNAADSTQAAAAPRPGAPRPGA